MKRLALLLGILIFVAPEARAAYIAPGASIVSASSVLREEGDDSSGQPDISADGRYVVFRTTSRNLFPDDVADPPGRYYSGGVFRRDLVTGALELVALGDVDSQADNATQAIGASAPSISGDGRYVAFTTGAALVPGDTNGATDVYVRDMDVARNDPHAYELVSAKDGGATPASYDKPTPDLPLQDPGATASPGTAISDDGRIVAFSVRNVHSDLPDHAAVDVPGGQIFVRDRATKRTTLVTAVAGSSPPRPISVSGAAADLGPVVLSADGSTVAWAGQDAQEQTAFLASEVPDARSYSYLWRRLVDGRTRRITGAVDLDDPACDGTYTPSFNATGPCYGPLADNEASVGSITATPPALSGDGLTVAFLASAPPRGVSAGVALDLFITDMRAGVSRKAGTVELTREGTGRDPTDSSPIDSVALSQDARWAAITTQRTRFLLPALQTLGDVRAKLGVDDVYLIDLSQRTIQRAVHGYRGDDPDDGIQPQLSLSADGRRIAFSSGAANLFFGDANQRTDVFTVDRLDAAPPAPVDQDPPEDPAPDPLPPPPAPTRKLSAFVKRAPAGKVRLQVKAPVKGRLTIEVRGKAADADGVPHGSAKLLGSVEKTIRKTGTFTVDVTIAKRYRTGLKRAGSLDAKATVRLQPKSGAALERAIAVRFKAR